MLATSTIKDAIEALYPPRPGAFRRRLRRSGSLSSQGSFRENAPLQFGGALSLPTTPTLSFGASSRRKPKSRFSELLLEHGERDLHQDWAVCASSSLLSDDRNGAVGGGSESCQMKQMEGRVRLCSQSIVFEPRQSSRGIIRIPFRHMVSAPFIGSAYSGSSGPDPKAAFGVGAGGDMSFGNGAPGAGNNPPGMAVVLRCDRHIVMKKDNAIGPYEYLQTPVEFRFAFLHSSPAAMLVLAQRLHEAEAATKKAASVSFAPGVAFDASAPPIIPLPSNDNAREDIVEKLLSPSVDRPFDTTNFLTVQEQPLTPNLRCSMQTPLLEQRGCAILTEHCLYFQPMVGSGQSMDSSAGKRSKAGSSGKAHAWQLEEMRAVARRYDGMKDRGLEIYLAHHQSSLLLTFESTEVRERVIGLISQNASATKAVPLPCYTDRSFVESALELWQAGQIDNFEYLLCLNAAAGRSFHDLSRYPVFPWVLSSYGERDDDDDELPAKLDVADPSVFRDLSKPVGNLTDDRFDDFRKRYEGMVQQQKSNASQHHLDAPFMYGTHYSAPGYVLFYLLRVMPEHMLCLQNGKFDVPDRLFHSIDATYKSILHNPADVKELIPEMFDPDCFDFLINSMGLQLGNLQTGHRVNDVILPVWAKSAKHFLRQNRAALESDYCTKNLPQWIDLIFGVSSRGAGAKEARNLFHPVSYFGPTDIEAFDNPDDKARAELQATEFGIVPDQLFAKAHPGKNESTGWSDSGALLTRDRLRESYGVGHSERFRAPVLNKQLSGFDEAPRRIEEEMSGTNPFD